MFCLTRKNGPVLFMAIRTLRHRSCAPSRLYRLRPSRLCARRLCHPRSYLLRLLRYYHLPQRPNIYCLSKSPSCKQVGFNVCCKELALARFTCIPLLTKLGWYRCSTLRRQLKLHRRNNHSHDCFILKNLIGDGLQLKFLRRSRLSSFKLRVEGHICLSGLFLLFFKEIANESSASLSIRFLSQTLLARSKSFTLSSSTFFC